MATQFPEHIQGSVEDPLARLAAFEPAAFPVISIYLNMQPDQHGRDPDVVPYLQREFKALARTWGPSSSERQSFDQDVEKILEYVKKDIKAAANGVAIFACAAADLFETIQMAAPIDEHRIYVSDQPHLYHLARLDDEYPRYAAVVTDANSARIWVFGMGQTLGTEEVEGKKVHRVKVGGWSQARYQRRVGNAHQDHAKEVIERLRRIAKEDRVSRIILAGDSAILPKLQEEMPAEMAAISDTVKVDVNASEQEVFTASLEKMQEQDARSDAEKVDRLFQEYRARGLAVVGRKDTLDALAIGQVDELLISASLEKELPEGETSLPDELVTKAKQTDARISFIQDASLLESVEGTGALLRWRM